MSGKKKRHKLAMTTVEVYRLFKVRDSGVVLSRSSDGVVAALGRQIFEEATAMLKTYSGEQTEAILRLRRREK